MDMESEEVIKLHPNEVKTAYKKAINEYREELELKCGQYQIDFIDADINQGFHQILMPYFIKRRKMQ
jgi:uncharacterized protein YecT (DUF1311 family)